MDAATLTPSGYLRRIEPIRGGLTAAGHLTGKLKKLERLNSEGIPRDHLAWALTQERIVRHARAQGRCLLCRGEPVNEAALCQVCYALLNGPELDLAVRWTSGVGP